MIKCSTLLNLVFKVTSDPYLVLFVLGEQTVVEWVGVFASRPFPTSCLSVTHDYRGKKT